jgi:hypothetical protein
VEETQKAVITPPKMRRGYFDMQNDRMIITLGDASPVLADLLAENSAVASTAGYIKHFPFRPKRSPNESRSAIFCCTGTPCFLKMNLT